MNPQQPGGTLPPPNPNQPYAPPAPQPTEQPSSASPHHEQYDFIMNPQLATKPPGASGGGTLMRAAIAGAGVVLLIIILIVVKSALSGSGSNVTAPLVSVAQDQTELMRLAGMVTTDVNNQSTLNFIFTARYSLATSNSQLLAYMSQNGVKADAKTLGLKHSTLGDKNLSSAAADSTYDQEFISIMQTDLTTYSRDLKSAYAVTKGPKGRALLSADYTSAQLLITQSKQQ